MNATKVIFRKFRDDGTVIAIFPEIKEGPYLVSCYMHLGQHGATTTDIISLSAPAKPEEYAALARELQSIGYTLTIRKRFNRRCVTGTLR